MIEALIDGERCGAVMADLAIGGTTHATRWVVLLETRARRARC